MTKCPYCGENFKITDFSEKEEGLFNDRYYFKGQKIREGFNGPVMHLWECSKCETLLAITESNWRS